MAPGDVGINIPKFSIQAMNMQFAYVKANEEAFDRLHTGIASKHHISKDKADMHL